MRFAFVEEHRHQLPVNRLCQVMGVSPRGYRAWRSRPASQRQRTDMVLLAHIREQFRLSLGSYGRPRMTEKLKELGFGVGQSSRAPCRGCGSKPETAWGCDPPAPRDHPPDTDHTSDRMWSWEYPACPMSVWSADATAQPAG